MPTTVRTPRDYQLAAVDAAWAALQTRQSCFLMMATGTGKTSIAAFLAREWTRPVLAVAHREELIVQLARTFSEVVGPDQVGVEQASHRARSNLFGPSPKCVIASKDTLCKPHRLHLYPPDHFGLIIVDEAHRCIGKNSSYFAIVNHFGDARRCGISATIDRSDREALGPLFECMAFEYDILTAMENGWLVDVRVAQPRMTTEIGYAGIDTVDGELREKQLDDILAQEGPAQIVVRNILEVVGTRKCLVFAAGVKQAQLVADILNRKQPGSAFSVHGKTAKEVRKGVVDAHKAGEFQFLVGCWIFVDGYDDPSIQAVAIGRPIRSRLVFTQVCGRGLRPLEGVVNDCMTAQERKAAIAASAKPDCLIIDAAGSCGRHKLVKAVDLFAGKMSDPVMLGDGGKNEEVVGTQLLSELKKARDDRDEFDLGRRGKLLATGDVRVRYLDPFGGGVEPDGDRLKFMRGDPASRGQVDFLKKKGIPTVGLTKKQAGAMIGSLKQQERDGPPLPWQVEFLKVRDLPTGVSKFEATAVIESVRRAESMLEFMPPDWK